LINQLIVVSESCYKREFQLARTQLKGNAQVRQQNDEHMRLLNAGFIADESAGATYPAVLLERSGLATGSPRVRH